MTKAEFLATYAWRPAGDMWCHTDYGLHTIESAFTIQAERQVMEEAATVRALQSLLLCCEDKLVEIAKATRLQKARESARKALHELRRQLRVEGVIDLARSRSRGRRRLPTPAEALARGCR